MADGLPAPSAERLAAENAAFRSRIAATDEVLRAIARHPADPRPVFDLIVRRVRELAAVSTATLIEYPTAPSCIDGRMPDMRRRHWQR